MGRGTAERAARMAAGLCRDCYSPPAPAKTYCQKCLDRVATQTRRTRYGVTADDEARFEAQVGLCAVCREPETIIHHRSGKRQALSVDHDHESNRVRDLLCDRCNNIVKYLEAGPDVVGAALAYIERWA